MKEPKPRFKLGDLVKDTSANRFGEISFIGPYDDYVPCRRYRVLEVDGSRLWWNDTYLKKISHAEFERLVRKKYGK